MFRKSPGIEAGCSLAEVADFISVLAVAISPMFANELGCSLASPACGPGGL